MFLFYVVPGVLLLLLLTEGRIEIREPIQNEIGNRAILIQCITYPNVSKSQTSGTVTKSKQLHAIDHDNDGNTTPKTESDRNLSPMVRAISQVFGDIYIY
jgi:hypothetical protein